MKVVVTLLLSAAVAIGAWTLKEVVSLKVAVAELRSDVSHMTRMQTALFSPTEPQIRK